MVLTAAYSFGQSGASPLFQDIKVVSAQPGPTSTPLVAKTGSSAPVGVRPVSSNPVIAEVAIPGYTGMLVETLDGSRIAESNSMLTFNPASNVKVATAYAVLKTFGPEFRFPTYVFTDGTFDRTSGVLNGNLYIQGRDPIFGFDHAVDIANELNRVGIHSVSGDLVVTDDFTINYSGSAQHSAEVLLDTMDPARRSPVANRVWLTYLANSGRSSKVTGVRGVTFTGKAYAQPIPSSLHLLFTHESAQIREIIKATLCYSNNFLAEKLGDMLGGPYAVAKLVQQGAAVSPAEFSIQTSSGLGYNRVTPNAMMKLLRTLRNDLTRYHMTFADIMPVAGIDKGTLENRFDADFAMGSVVGKTGTMANTDAGVSALSGEINTKNGRVLFVIFNNRGGVSRFRSFQNSFVSLIQNQFGGASRLNYTPIPLDARLAQTRISYPADSPLGND